MNNSIPLIFRIAYKNRLNDKIAYKIIGVGQSFPDIGADWIIIGVDQYVGLISKGRKVFSGDIYQFLHMTHPITISLEHGLRFMHGEFQLNNIIVEFGHFLGTVYELQDEQDEKKEAIA